MVWALALCQTPDPGVVGMKALDEGKYESAAQAFSQAITADPKDYAAHFNLALALGFLHRDAEAVTEYRKTLELKPGLYEAELNAGMLLVRQRKPAEAAPLLQDAADQKPKEFRPRFYLAEAQLQKGEAAKAGENYRLALEADPQSAAAELGMGRAQASQGTMAEAAPHFRRAAELDRNYADALLELAELYEKNGQAGEALAIYNRFPDDPAAQEHAGELMLENKQYADAIPHLQAAYQKSPTQPNRLALALAFLSIRKFEDALPLLQGAAAAEPANYDVRMMYGRALRDAKQFPAAAREFSEALKLKPGDAKTWSDLGGVLYMAGDYQPALAAFERAAQLGEETPGNWFLRAIILDKLKQIKPALDAYQRFLSMSRGENSDQEFQARQRSRILKLELQKR